MSEAKDGEGAKGAERSLHKKSFFGHTAFIYNPFIYKVKFNLTYEASVV